MITIRTKDPEVFTKWFKMTLISDGWVTKYDLSLYGWLNWGEEPDIEDKKLGWSDMYGISSITPRRYMSGDFTYDIQLKEPEEL